MNKIKKITRFIFISLVLIGIIFVIYLLSNIDTLATFMVSSAYMFPLYLIVPCILLLVLGGIFNLFHLILKKTNIKIDKFERNIKLLGKDNMQIIIDKNVTKEKCRDILKADYFRDIPCNGNIFTIYFIAKQFYICDIEKLQKGLIGAILLKWLGENTISIKETSNKKTYIEFNNSKFNNNLEKYLFLILKKAADSNGKLEKGELEKWCTNNYLTIVVWLSKVENEVGDNLIKNKLIKIDKIYKNYKKASFTPILYETALKIYGLKKYLNDFTNLDNKDILDVKLLKEYLICAILLDESNNIKNELKQIYPEAIQMINFDLPIIDLIDEILDFIVPAGIGEKYRV